MEIIINNTNRIVEIWLAHVDSCTPKEREVMEKIHEHVAIYKPLKYTVVVYESGNFDLLNSTKELLLHNRNK